MNNNIGTILIVDDEADLRDVLEMILMEMKVNIIKASDGRQALEILKTQEVDAVISDINMPHMTGLELLREVRNLAMDVPFVFVTAYGDKANLLEALRLGALDFIEKPFDNQDVLKVTEKALELGLSLHEVQAELDSFYQMMSLPTEEIAKLKNVRRAAMLLKIESEIYKNKKTADGREQ